VAVFVDESAHLSRRGRPLDILTLPGAFAAGSGQSSSQAPSWGEQAVAGPLVTITRLSERIRDEFEEAPGLAITIGEGVRFWVLDAETCTRVLGELRDVGFLVETADGRFRRTAAA
jgi:hypothetical protein